MEVLNHPWFSDNQKNCEQHQFEQKNRSDEFLNLCPKAMNYRKIKKTIKKNKGEINRKQFDNFHKKNL